MGFFSKNKKKTDLMAIRIANDGVYSACIRHVTGSLPALDFLAFYPNDQQTQAALLERLARESPAKQKRCLLQLNSRDYQWFAIDHLNVPDTELRSAMQWRLKELLDYPVESAYFDVLKVPGDVQNGGRNQSLIAIVAANQTLANFQQLFHTAKLPLAVIDVAELAQRNWSVCLESPGRGLAMLSFDQYGGMLTVTFSGELYLARRLEINLSDLQHADESERTASYERISLELQRSLDHFDRQHNYITTEKLVLAPLGQSASPLRDFLTANMYLPVEILDLSSLVQMDTIPELKDAARQAAFFSIIGAALRQDEVVA
ncbi:agglutinin biogenesis protein MshI [Undibacterium fentianense]|uniref:Agglutinin biogenesis protein MshI n=1 Tax=Undibacterium fentianense TaxID=2828728 RepID=A0A941DZ03_9BURK|nr:agglutinin biogenesis protein MshI [Undibacterium fentianense]MBR7800064.1 agglutinin biogenesis protein MshI [Undibacterium fentianense]